MKEIFELLLQLEALTYAVASLPEGSCWPGGNQQRHELRAKIADKVAALKAEEGLHDAK